jgi:DnaJ family protein C protein 9
MDLYSVLHVEKDASLVEITKAYRRLALKYHPDRNVKGTEKFQKISIAYEVLADDNQRAVYDATGSFEGSGEAMPDELAKKAQEFRLDEDRVGDMINNFYDNYAGSPEEEADIVESYNKTGGNFAKMIARDIIFRNERGEITRFKELIEKLIRQRVVTTTLEWQKTANKEKVRKMEMKFEKERYEADEVLAEMEDSKKKNRKEDQVSNLKALILNRHQKQQAAFENQIKNLEDKYVTGKKSARR